MGISRWRAESRRLPISCRAASTCRTRSRTPSFSDARSASSASLLEPATAAVVAESPARRAALTSRSEERRVGKACVSTCRSRWSPYHSKKKVQENLDDTVVKYQHQKQRLYQSP